MAFDIKIRELVGADLKDFKLVLMTEVYLTNESGQKSKSVGFFKDPDVAEAFAGAQTDANYHKTAPALILTDGNQAFVMTDQTSVVLFDDEKETIEIKRKALEKLSPVERKLLGFENPLS